MGDQFSESDFAKTIGHPIMVALGALLTWLTAGMSGSIGSALTALLLVSFLAFSLMYRRYLGILASGGDPEGSPERELNTPAPLWPAWSFDRCLFLTFVYPIAMIFLIWTVSGHTGQAELALGLKPLVERLYRCQLWACGLRDLEPHA